ncbi:MAG: NAD-dependent epimerase/dehydratase family protein [Clostridia bacterium]|nr:NAD-dependent epimerase/dehydratase family protein [Clostridia bacterium]
MKIFLTGAGGFIGRNIKEQLGSKHQIISYSHKDIDLCKTESVCEVLQGESFDAIIHAAQMPTHRAAQNAEGAVMTNLLMQACISKAAALCGVKKIINYGSGSEYARNRELVDVSEKQIGKNIPYDITGFTKYLSNLINESGVKQYNLRCFGVFGKYEDYTIRFISNAICRVLCGYSISLKQDRYFSYVYIDDLAVITDIFLQNNFKYNDYNIVSSEKWSLLDIARLVRKISIKDVAINVALQGRGLEYSGSNKRFLSEYLYTFTPMIDSINMLFDWYVLNFDTIDREKILYCR